MGFSSASNLSRSGGGDADLAGRGGGDGERDAAVVGGKWCRLFSSERDTIATNIIMRDVYEEGRCMVGW